MAVAGILTPDRGRIRWRERLFLDSDRGVCLSANQRRLGVVFQDQRLFPHLSAADNLRYGERRRATACLSLSYDQIVEILDLGDCLHRLPGNLSGGERQRVALGRAMLCAPELLLMDEPVTAVDEPRRHTILRYLADVISEWSIPVLYVSHNRVEVQRLADWVVVVDSGRIIASGTPDRVLEEPGEGLSAVPSLSVPINLLRLEDLRDTPDGEWSARLPGSSDNERVQIIRSERAPSAPVYVGFSPNDVVLTPDPAPRLSARNHLPGRIREIVAGEHQLYVAVEVGEQTVWATVTPEAAAELDLSVGTQIICLIKTAALEWVD